MTRLRRWWKRMIRIVLVILVFLALTFVSILALVRPGSKVELATTSPYGIACASQNFTAAGAELEYQLVQRFMPVIYLHKDEPLNEDEIIPGWQVLPYGNGYIIVISFFMSDDFASKRYVINGLPLNPTRLGVSVQNEIGLGDGHPGEVESVKILVIYLGETDGGEQVFAIGEVKLKIHTLWSNPLPSDAFSCFGGSRLELLFSQGGHTPHRNQRECNQNNYEVFETIIGKIRISPDNCAYDTLVHPMAEAWQDVGDPPYLVDIFANTPLAEMFPDESIFLTNFCGGQREDDSHVCEAKYEFIRTTDSSTWW
jgi:hypothetical protein